MVMWMCPHIFFEAIVKSLILIISYPRFHSEPPNFILFSHSFYSLFPLIGLCVPVSKTKNAALFDMMKTTSKPYLAKVNRGFKFFIIRAVFTCPLVHQVSCLHGFWIIFDISFANHFNNRRSRLKLYVTNNFCLIFKFQTKFVFEE